jgi:hypothetical protein
MPEPRPLIYCFADIETDGPVPGINSMLSLGCAAFDENGAEISVFSASLIELDDAQGDPATLDWWSRQDKIYSQIRTGPRPPSIVFADFVSWISLLEGDAVFAAHPLLFDGIWIDWYLKKFTGRRIFEGPFAERCLFVGAGIDVPSYAHAALNTPYVRSRPKYSAEMLGGHAHSHLPLDDARCHAAVFFYSRNAVRASAPIGKSPVQG